MPLVLKLFLHQDVQQVVENKTDRIENRSVALKFLSDRVTRDLPFRIAFFTSATSAPVPQKSKRKTARRQKRAKTKPHHHPSSGDAHLLHRRGPIQTQTVV